MKMARKWLLGCLIILLVAACQPDSESPMASPSDLPNASIPMKPVQTACQNLHKVEEILDLLKQIHENINSFCLFEMPTEELEKIWGVKIFDFAILTQPSSLTDYQTFQQYQQKLNRLFRERNVYDKKPSFYLQKEIDYSRRNQWGQPEIKFSIKISPSYEKLSARSEHIDWQGMPRYLPNPDKELFVRPRQQVKDQSLPYNYKPSNTKPFNTQEKTTKLALRCSFWINHQDIKNMPILQMKFSQLSILPTEITFFNFYQLPKECK